MPDPANHEKSLALFDFDGTITSKDSFLLFLQFAISIPKLVIGACLLSPTLLKYKIGKLSNNQAKEIVFKFFFADWKIELFKKIAEQFADSVLPKIVKESAKEKIAWHKSQSHEIVVVSASFEIYLQPWCKKENIDLLGTQLEEKNKKLTGNFSSPNCHGPEKVRRIKAIFDLSKYNHIYTYGDSSGDQEILELADKPHFRSFNK